MDYLTLRGTSVEVRAILGDEAVGTEIAGYAALFGVLSDPLTDSAGRPFVERIERGAFARAIAEGQDVRCLFNHDQSMVLGRTASKTLVLTEDDKGLYFRCQAPDTQIGQDVMTSIRRGDVSQCSFAFKVVKDDRTTVNGQNLRVITDLNLFDVGPVAYPAYPATSVMVRSITFPDFIEPTWSASQSRARAITRLATIGRA